MTLRLILFLTILFGSLSCQDSAQNHFWNEANAPEKTGRLVANDLLARDDLMMYETEHATAVHYAEACAALGAARLAGLLNDKETIDRLSTRYARVISDSITNTANHVDANVYGILPLELYRQTGEDAFLKQGLALADGQWADTLPNGLTDQTRYWIDDVYMIAALQTQAYRVTGDEAYLERAAKTVEDYLKKLQRPNGLFHHGEGAPFFWGRGNGWVAAGMAELLSELPESHPRYQAISDGYVKMMNALLQHQAEDGMWRQLIDVEESWKETSCTAMFGYAMAVGVGREILEAPEYTTAYQKAWNALAGYINEEGKVAEVCVGTGKSADINYYLNRPRVVGDLHGQAPVLWFAHKLLAE